MQSNSAHLVRVEVMEYFQHRASAVDYHIERAVQRRQHFAGDVHHRAVHLDHMAERLA
jgi:hypothetical protein